MQFAKTKRVKLKGKARVALRQAIFERDKNQCVICGSTEWLQHHHEPCGSKREDRIETGLVLCQNCHYRRHNGPNSDEIKRYCKIYLQRLYEPRINYGRGENL